MTQANEVMDPQPLDREGTFKVKPVDWSVYQAKSGAVAINVDFAVLAQWNGNEWESWEDFVPYRVRGSFYVIDKEGKPNTTAIKQMAPLGWSGEFAQIIGSAPDIEVQVDVKEEIYNGASTFKVAWVNGMDRVPGASPNAAGVDEIKKLDGRFGSLLRAAAGAAK